MVLDSRPWTMTAQWVRRRCQYSVLEKRKAGRDSANAIPEMLAAVRLESAVRERDAAVDTSFHRSHWKLKRQNVTKMQMENGCCCEIQSRVATEA